MFDEIKSVVNIWAAGGVIFWLFGFGLAEYTIGFTLFLLVLAGIYHMWQWSDSKKAQAERAHERSLLNQMTEDERKVYFRQKRENIMISFKEGEIKSLNEKEERLARAEARAERELRLAEKQAQNNANTVKLPPGTKLAATAYVGYKVGKKIASW